MKNSLTSFEEISTRWQDHLANSQGQQLFEHSLAVAAVSLFLANRDFATTSEQNLALVLGSLAHDLGKLLPEYQDTFRVDSKKRKAKIYHEEASYLSFSVLFPSFRDSLKELFETDSAETIYSLSGNLVFTHHPKRGYDRPPYHTDSVLQIAERMGNLEDFLRLSSEFFASGLRVLAETTVPEQTELRRTLALVLSSNPAVPAYDSAIVGLEEAHTESVKVCTTRQMLRTVFVMADRIVSSWTASQMNQIARDFYCGHKEISDAIPTLVDTEVTPPKKAIRRRSGQSKFDRLSNRQIEIARDCTGHLLTKVDLLGGVGKTRIGLYWSLMLAKTSPAQQILFVMPTNTLVDTKYIDVKRELEAIWGENHSFSIEAFYTEERQFAHNAPTGALNSNIIITNIDFLLNAFFRHDRTERVYRYLQSPIIFDEYHDFVGREPIFFNFLKLLDMRTRLVGAPSLLLSATPLPIERYLGQDGDPSFGVHRVPFDAIKHWNQGKVKCAYSRDLKILEGESDLRFFNSSAQSIIDYLHHKGDRVLNGTIDDEGKKEILSEIMNSRGPDRTDASKSISTAMILNNANISGRNVLETLCSPWKTLQSFARTNRFGNLKKPTFTVLDLGEIDREKKQDARVLHTEDRVVGFLSSRKIAERWGQKLKKRFRESAELKRDEMAALYYEFMDEERDLVHEWMDSQFKASLKASSHLYPAYFQNPLPKVSKNEAKYVGKNVRSSYGGHYVAPQKMAVKGFGKQASLGRHLTDHLPTIESWEFDKFVEGTDRLNHTFLERMDSRGMQYKERAPQLFKESTPFERYKLWRLVSRCNKTPLVLVSNKGQDHYVYLIQAIDGEFRRLGLIRRKYLNHLGLEVRTGAKRGYAE